MIVVPTEKKHLEVLKSWFEDGDSARRWGGPEIIYPFTQRGFLKDIGWGRLSSWSLLGETSELMGFGQYYEKLDRCHLARLVIAPQHRAKKLGQQFIRQLMNIGMQDLGKSECSLFVINSNKAAVGCYTCLNYKPAAWPPGQQLIPGIGFMTWKHPD